MSKHNIPVPALGESIQEAVIARWTKNVGDTVMVDEVLVELETDKVTLEVNAPCSGVLEAIAYPQGAAVKFGEVLGIMEERAVAHQEVAAQQVEQPKGGVAGIPSVSAQKIAQEHDIDLSKVVGSGKDGRITKGDVLGSMDASSSSAKKEEGHMKAAEVACSSDVSDAKRQVRVPMSKLRQVIAKRLKESQNTAAMLTTFNEIDMSNVVALRQKHKEEFEKKHGVKLGFMSFFVKAAVHALKAVPNVNAFIEPPEIVQNNFYDIAVAVGTEQGLVVPVVRDADRLSFAQIEERIADFAKRARAGKLGVSEMTGGTFSITNGGVYGSLMSTPIINPPQSAILGMHKTMERAVVVDSQVVVRPMMYVALSYDHRIIDGKEAVTFLVKIKEAIENPERILLEI